MSDSDYWMICANIYLAASLGSSDANFGRPVLIAIAALHYLFVVLT